MSLPIHSVADAERDRPLFEAVARAFTQAASRPIRTQTDQIPFELADRANLLGNALRLLPSALMHPSALPVVGAMTLAAILPETEEERARFANDEANLFGYLLASAWVSGVRCSQECGETFTAEVVRPSLSTGPSEAWQGIVDNVKGFGLSPKAIDEILCAGLTQLTQNGADIPLIDQIVAPHAIVQAALAKPVTLA
jgi:hypothetical protein